MTVAELAAQVEKAIPVLGSPEAIWAGSMLRHTEVRKAREALAVLVGLAARTEKAEKELEERVGLSREQLQRAADQRMAVEARAAQTEKAWNALPDPDKLGWLAQWLDQYDADRGVTDEHDVQDDLRRWARLARAALAGDQ